MSQSIFPGPIAPENNPPIEPLYFKPSDFTITAISLGLPTVVTTTSSTTAPATNNFVVGQLVRFIIPPANGTRELNGVTGYVITLPASNQVGVNINSKNFTSFIANPPKSPTPPQIVAIGDINTGTTNSSGRTNNGTTIPGSFLNTSPILQT